MAQFTNREFGITEFTLDWDETFKLMSAGIIEPVDNKAMDSRAAPPKIVAENLSEERLLLDLFTSLGIQIQQLQ